MENFQKKQKFKSVEEIIDFIDNSSSIEKSPCDFYEPDIIEFNGTELDVLKLVKKYGLNLKIERKSRDNTYKSFNRGTQNTPNTYCVGPKSMYGHTPYKLNIKGYNIKITQNTKTNYNTRYTSTLSDKLKADEKYVVLDIETTGLEPLFDDIIQICIYENETNYILKYLPLEKKETNTAYEINRIDDDLLKKQRALTQEDIDAAIKRFDLENKTVVIWTGKNYFDRVFIECYFHEHKLKGLEKIRFYNGADLLELIENYPLKSKSKDTIARLYEIDITNAHRALEDCRIEKLIVENLLNKNYTPLINNGHYVNLLNEIRFLFLSNSSTFNTEELYDNFCEVLLAKNGRVLEDYDNHPQTKGKEWIDIHHIDEKILDNISTRTNNAKQNQDLCELDKLKPYNKKERLVYATKVEHFLLHCLLNLINNTSLGVHFLFGDLLKMEIGIFNESSSAFYIQEKRKETYYSIVDFNSLVDIYREVLNQQRLTPSLVENFYKLDFYVYNKEKYESIINKLKAD